MRAFEIQSNKTLQRLKSTHLFRRKNLSVSKLAYVVEEEKLSRKNIHNRQFSIPEASMDKSILKAKRRLAKYHSTKSIDDLFEQKILKRIQDSKELVKSQHLNSLIHAVLAQSERFTEAFLDTARNDLDRYRLANTHDQFGRTALHYACALGQKNIVKMLLVAGTQLTKDSLLRTPSHYLAWSDNIAILDILYHPYKGQASEKTNCNTIARAVVFSKPRNPPTDLETTSLHDSFPSIELLVEDLNEDVHDMIERMNKQPSQALEAPRADADLEGRTPLFHAVLNNNPQMTKELLNRGANPIQEDVYGKRPSELTSNKDIQNILLSFIKRSCNSGMDIQELRILNKSDVNFQTGKLSDSLVISAIQSTDLERVKVLLDKKADLLQTNSKGWNALHAAVKADNLEIIKFLLEGGSSNFEFGVKSWIASAWKAVDVITKDHLSILHIAALHSSIGTLDYILKFLRKREDVKNLKDVPDALRVDFLTADELIESQARRKLTPFLLAVSKKRYQQARRLMEHLCNIYVADDRLQNAMHIATINESPRFIKVLVNYDSDKNVLRKSADTRNRRPIDLDKYDAFTECFYHIWDFAYNANLDMLRKVVVTGEYSINEQTPIQLLSPLYVAVQYKQFEMAKLICEMGGNCRLRASNGKSPLNLVNQWPDGPEKYEYLKIFKIIKKDLAIGKNVTFGLNNLKNDDDVPYSLITTIVSKVHERCSGVLELFELLGKDLNESISFRDFSGIVSWLGLKIPKRDLQKLFDHIDTDENDEIDCNELLMALQKEY